MGSNQQGFTMVDRLIIVAVIGLVVLEYFLK
jgi:Tfp pilus assembly protein PilE